MRPLILRRPLHAPRRDPAPSRLAYRLHRLWLTPLVRVATRVGLPVALVVGLAAAWVSDPGNRAAVMARVDALRAALQERPEFMVHRLAVHGASDVLAESIRAALALDLPQSSFAIDLAAARTRVEGFDAVARADLRILPGGILSVEVAERLPALVWRDREGLWLLDAGGHRVAAIAGRALRPDLPLVAGDGADRAAAEALDLYAAAGPLAPRLRGLVRQGERRWDVVLDRDQRILLPAEGAVAALERAVALDMAEGLLARDLGLIDLRVPRRTIVRLTPAAATAHRASLTAETGRPQR
jgi:cell division protein FtsQ